MNEEDGYERSPVDDTAIGEGADRIEFFVAGEPQPKGSTRAFYVKKLDRVVTTTTNKNTKQWQLRVSTEAQRANESRNGAFFCNDDRCGYEVAADFTFTRPKSTPKKVHLNTKRPDLDKLIRAVLDGIVNVLIPDDALVISIRATKKYGEENEVPGARISVIRIK